MGSKSRPPGTPFGNLPVEWLQHMDDRDDRGRGKKEMTKIEQGTSLMAALRH